MLTLVATSGLFVHAGPQVAAAAPARATNPLAVAPLYVDPASQAARQVRSQSSPPAAVRLIADTAQSRWFGDWNPTSEVAADVDRYVTAARSRQQLPVLTLYAIPNRDCGGDSGGGLPSARAYAAWIAAVVRGVDGRRAAVVLEPDALAGLDCLGAAAKRERYAMLKDATSRLTASRATALYLDAGHADWLSPAAAAGRLRAVGVGKARGFSLNVSNFGTTRDQIAYGEAISARTGGAHYVIDTSRNGAGPAKASATSWCNPRGRAVGTRPTTRTAGAHADAYLWIKNPGESDGRCNRGDPAAGQWFGSYARGLVQNSRYA